MNATTLAGTVGAGRHPLPRPRVQSRGDGLLTEPSIDQATLRDESDRERQLVVLFADIVGFTRYAEDRPPLQVLALMRDVHAHLERAVVEHGGRVEKCLGDGVMATFGAAGAGPGDAADALAAARSILAAIDRWNFARAADGLDTIRLSIGLHRGVVALGWVGSGAGAERVALGDAVNVAHRLEKLTRDLACRLVASDDVVAAVRQGANGEVPALLADLRPAPPQSLRGRRRPVAIWTLAS